MTANFDSRSSRYAFMSVCNYLFHFHQFCFILNDHSLRWAFLWHHISSNKKANDCKFWQLIKQICFYVCMKLFTSFQPKVRNNALRYRIWTEIFEVFSQGTYNFQTLRNETLVIAKIFSFTMFDMKLWLKEENILHKSCAFGWMNLNELQRSFVCKSRSSFIHHFKSISAILEIFTISLITSWTVSVCKIRWKIWISFQLPFECAQYRFENEAVHSYDLTTIITTISSCFGTESNFNFIYQVKD